MEEKSGLTIEGTQRAICKGTYGNKEWSSEERQAACIRANETYEPVTTETSVYWNTGFITLGLLLIFCVMMFYRKLKQRKVSSAKTKSRK